MDAAEEKNRPKFNFTLPIIMLEKVVSNSDMVHPCSKSTLDTVQKQVKSCRKI